MKNQDLTITLLVDQSPDEVFAAIMNVRGWWSQGLEGSSAKVGDEFTYRYEDRHCSTQKVIEAVPGRRVAWRVLDADLAIGEKRSEWTGTEIRFDIARKRGKTELRFTHVGLVPEFDCFEACSRGWSFYIEDSLRRLIATGTGKPHQPRIASVG
jgi:hypothetical protein